MKFPDFLYGNIGRKFKYAAFAQFFLLALASIFGGLFMMFFGFYTFVIDGIFTGIGLIGIPVLFFGPIIAYFSSWVVYAFGELVENSKINAENTTELVEDVERASQNIFVCAQNSLTILEQQKNISGLLKIEGDAVQSNLQTSIKQSKVQHDEMMAKLNETAYNAYATAQNLNILTDQKKGSNN